MTDVFSSAGDGVGELPSEVLSLFAAHGTILRAVTLRCGVDSLVGATYLAVVAGRLRVVTRPSLLTTPVELLGVRAATVEGAADLRPTLRIAHDGGDAVVSLSYGEPEPVARFLAEDPTDAVPPPRELVAEPMLSEAPSADLQEARGHLLGVLQSRATSHASRLLAVLGRRVGPSDRKAAIARLEAEGRRTGWRDQLALAELLLLDGRANDAATALRKAKQQGATSDHCGDLFQRITRASNEAAAQRASARAAEPRQERPKDARPQRAPRDKPKPEKAAETSGRDQETKRSWVLPALMIAILLIAVLLFVATRSE